MQTLYYETCNFIEHQGNVIDLSAYRKKLAAGQASLSAQAVAPPCAPPAPRRTHTRRAGRRWRRLFWAADICASAALVVLTISFVVQFIRL